MEMFLRPYHELARCFSHHLQIAIILIDGDFLPGQERITDQGRSPIPCASSPLFTCSVPVSHDKVTLKERPHHHTVAPPLGPSSTMWEDKALIQKGKWKIKFLFLWIVPYYMTICWVTVVEATAFHLTNLPLPSPTVLTWKYLIQETLSIFYCVCGCFACCWHTCFLKSYFFHLFLPTPPNPFQHPNAR